MKRRNFIKSTLAGASVMSISQMLNCIQKKSNVIIPKRILGRTGEELSVIGFGGVLVMDETQKDSNDAVAKAFELGVNYYDVAPSYGNAELRLGPALEPYRKNSFLACKTGERTAKESLRELNSSLKNMRTDYFDLYQLHYLTTQEDIDIAFGPNGAMETVLKAKEEGKIRYVGFSAHSEEAALAAMEHYDFDTILFPVNFGAWLRFDWGPKVVAKAKESNKGILALKALAFERVGEGEEKPYKKCWYKPIPIDQEDLLAKAMRFTFSQGVTAAVPPGEPAYWPIALDIIQNLTEITSPEVAELEQAAQKINTPIFKIGVS